jgi:PAS domain-containing protein
MWLVPPVFWFECRCGAQMMLGVLVVALMSAAGVSLSTVPQACLVYLGILTLGGCHDVPVCQPVHMALMVVFAFAVGGAAVASARRFVGHVRTQIELQEQSELIGLLREFEASGSDWLWQLDKDLRLTYMSRAMAEAIGKPLSKLIGGHARNILDPDGNAVQLSAGMRRLMLHAAERTAFRDVAIRSIMAAVGGRSPPSRSSTLKGRFHGWRGVGSDITDTRLSGNDAVRACAPRPVDRRRQPPAPAVNSWKKHCFARSAAIAPARCCLSTSTASIGQRHARPLGRRSAIVRSRPPP